MNTYIIINGLNVTLIDRISMVDAKHTAINICDHSKEVIVRQVNDITNWSMTRIHTINY